MFLFFCLDFNQTHVSRVELCWSNRIKLKKSAIHSSHFKCLRTIYEDYRKVHSSKCWNLSPSSTRDNSSIFLNLCMWESKEVKPINPKSNKVLHLQWTAVKKNRHAQRFAFAWISEKARTRSRISFAFGSIYKANMFISEFVHRLTAVELFMWFSFFTFGLVYCAKSAHDHFFRLFLYVILVVRFVCATFLVRAMILASFCHIMSHLSVVMASLCG